jgi:haloacetate dehalogenase
MGARGSDHRFSRLSLMFEGFSHQRVQTGDAEISCVVGGSGDPVLFLHGYPQNKSMWARVACQLMGKYTVVCADLRGYGDSSKPPANQDNSNYSFRSLAMDQREVMQVLGFDTFHLVGHDRGARVGHRLALDYPQAVSSLTVMDIIPTSAMFEGTDSHLARSYWHWFFLSQPAPLPERLIGGDPDFFFETCLTSWGGMNLGDFDAELLDHYRRSWHDDRMIHATCADYRAAATVDLEHDATDIDRLVDCPTLVLFGSEGRMARLFDMAAEWRKRFSNPEVASLPGGHYFVDQYSDHVASLLQDFLGRAV